MGSPLIYCQRAAPSHAQSLLSTCYRYARLTLSTPALSRVIPNITHKLQSIISSLSFIHCVLESSVCLVLASITPREFKTPPVSCELSENNQRKLLFENLYSKTFWRLFAGNSAFWPQWCLHLTGLC